jgi:mono/diheme cytochrome c family protein
MMRFSPGLGAIRGWLALTAFAGACAATPAAAQDLSRGRALYETRCTACHETSVHQRGSRKAQSFAALRAEVERWNASTGGDWKRDEVDQVTT